MYKPTEKEKNNCICIVKDILKIDDDNLCESYVNQIFSIAYSIGGDYGNKTLRSIAKIVLKDVWNGQPIGKSEEPLPKGYSNKLTN